MTLFDERELVEGGIDLQGGAPRRLVVEEHDDELGGVRQLAPVRLLTRAARCGRVPAGHDRPTRPAGRRRRPRADAPSGTRRARPSSRSRSTCRQGGARSRPGRSRRPSSPATAGCSSKSQNDSIPAISITRRSWISPHRPRVCDSPRRALTRFPVCVRRLSWVSRTISSSLWISPYARCRCCSSSPTFVSTFSSDFRNGSTYSPRRPIAASVNDWAFARNASAESARIDVWTRSSKARRSAASAPSTSASACRALRRVLQCLVTLRKRPAQRHEVDAGGAGDEPDDQEKHRHEGEGP